MLSRKENRTHVRFEAVQPALKRFPLQKQNSSIERDEMIGVMGTTTSGMLPSPLVVPLAGAECRIIISLSPQSWHERPNAFSLPKTTTTVVGDADLFSLDRKRFFGRPPSLKYPRADWTRPSPPPPAFFTGIRIRPWPLLWQKEEID